ncbi:aliphatic sulfonate ABC transporter substrate-binding protein [Actinocorallia sp. A-T 12471]|uniref:aliphatic sulfonate ABC transporter substrate-binding protein n=1 Tax=Actinocorallia sp. A-T 12471 TaxID=3089813 RepID=UPI0029D21171|nr:aliphatic sulfonate ABC transporter substrate-binding protein [Actinocorallia sp. A-T 12471]MDX6739044.1 aliphatic sulfonate ABC transporter substrate-binding protein [Actinocorallia sp. A-T 12471]
MIRTAAALAAVALLAAGCSSSAEDGKPEVKLDYAYYNPASLVIREQGWLEKDGLDVTWVLSAGSNKANENLRAGTVDVGSTAGAAALQARANGTPIKAIEIYSHPEWTALVTGKDSSITSVTQLKGKKVAATKGTDPYFFLLQALREHGLSGGDVEVVNLQHADGEAALKRGDVAAWAGLDPIMATSEVGSGSKLFYRNTGFTSYGFLNAREAFIKDHPDLAQKVVDAYQKAREWITANPDEAVALLAKESGVSPEVAKVVLTQRTDFTVSPVPGDAQRTVLERILPVLVDEGQVKDESSAKTALDTLFDPQFAQKATAP